MLFLFWHFTNIIQKIKIIVRNQRSVKTYHYQGRHQLTLFYFVCHPCPSSMYKRQRNGNNINKLSKIFYIVQCIKYFRTVQYVKHSFHLQCVAQFRLILDQRNHWIQAPLLKLYQIYIGRPYFETMITCKLMKEQAQSCHVRLLQKYLKENQ